MQAIDNLKTCCADLEGLLDELTVEDWDGIDDLTWDPRKRDRRTR